MFRYANKGIGKEEKIMKSVTPQTHSVIELTKEDISYLETELNVKIKALDYENIDFISKQEIEYEEHCLRHEREFGEEPNSIGNWEEWGRISQNAPIQAIKRLSNRFDIELPEHTRFFTCALFNIGLIY